MLPLAALPLAPIVGSAVLGSAAFLGIRKARRDENAFFSMRWVDVDAEDGESCTIIGEETVPNGKIWYLCDEKSEAPGMECSPVTSSDLEGYLCKQPKLGGARCMPTHTAKPPSQRLQLTLVCARACRRDRRTLLKFWGS